MIVLLVLMNNQSRGERIDRGSSIGGEGIYVVLLVVVVKFQGHMLGWEGVLVIAHEWGSNKFCNQVGLCDICCASSVPTPGSRIVFWKKKVGVVRFYVSSRSDKGLRMERFFTLSLPCCIHLIVNECS